MLFHDLCFTMVLRTQNLWLNAAMEFGYAGLFLLGAWNCYEPVSYTHLLLITNDGDLAHRLLSPRHHVDKTYYAHITGSLPADAVRRFQDGIVLEDGTTCMPARLKLLFDQPDVYKRQPCYYTSIFFAF